MKKITISFAFVLLLSVTHSQSNRFGDLPFETSKIKDKNNDGDNNNGNGNGNQQDQPANAPIDGGIVVLLAIGVFYGFKKIKDRQAALKQQTL